MADDKVRGDGYFQFYPGDYLRDTSGLSLIEHGAYLLLLTNYYSQNGLNDEKPRLYRMCGAGSDEEKQAVDFVTGKYFININGVLRNKRADKEIARRQAFLDEQSRKGALGGRPRKNPDESRGLAGAKAGEKPRGKPDESLASASASALPTAPKIKVKRVCVQFVTPTLAEVADYCAERGNNVDPIKFHAHYTSNGWRVGKNPMKSWKAAVVTWERNNP